MPTHWLASRRGPPHRCPAHRNLPPDLITFTEQDHTHPLPWTALYLLATCLHMRDISSPTSSNAMQELEDAHHSVRQKRRRLPAGTSDYQAAWLLDGDDSGESGSEQEV